MKKSYTYNVKLLLSYIIIFTFLFLCPQKVLASENTFFTDCNIIGTIILDAPVYQIPDTDTTIITTISLDTQIQIIGYSEDGWYSINLGGIYYVPASFIEADISDNDISENDNSENDDEQLNLSEGQITTKYHVYQYSVYFDATNYDEVISFLETGIRLHAQEIVINCINMNYNVYKVAIEYLDQYRDICKSYDLANSNGYSFSYNTSANNVTLTIYPMYYSTLEEEIALDTLIDTLISQINPNDSDYNKIKNIHDNICRINKYSYNTLNYTSEREYRSAYDVMVYNESVCSGYALLFQKCMEILGIPSYYYSGDAGGFHAWNIVYCDDNWYQLDCTWDDNDYGNGCNYNYFLKGNLYDHKYIGNIPISSKAHP